MTYKDDLLSCGVLIQDKINSHTTNTVEFGEYNKGKDDFYHMGLSIDNLRGNKDYILKFIQQDKYLLDNQNFKLMVLVTNAIGERIRGERITIEGDNSTYTSTTGNNGVAVFTLPRVINSVIYYASIGTVFESEDSIIINSNQFIENADEELY